LIAKIATVTSTYRAGLNVHADFYAEVMKIFGGATVLVNGSMKHDVGDGRPMNPVFHDLLAVEGSSLEPK